MQQKRIHFISCLDLSETLTENQSKKSNFYISFVLVPVSIVVVVDYSFHHCSPSKTTAKA